MSKPANEVSIPISWDDAEGVITTLFAAGGETVRDPKEALVAVGVFLTGPRAGHWFVLDDLPLSEIAPRLLH